MARNFMTDVPEDKVFWSHDGQMYRNLNELAQGLANMNDETYMYHANEAKNDFARWVQDVIGDRDLAFDLENTTSRQEALKKVNSRLNYYSMVR